MNFGILLSGCGVYDGAEIQEAVLSMLAVSELGDSYTCIGVNADQFHVINHLTGEPMNESRNMLVEAARIARGNIVPIQDIQPRDIDALIIPGGFGSAKNFTKWAFDGPDGTILPEVKLLIVNLVNIGKPIAALCVSPVVVAKALEGSTIHPSLTLGTTTESSPYDIEAFSQGLQKTGAETTYKTIHEIHVDKVNKIITAPCYMMDASISDVWKNIREAITELKKLATI
ncbi:isoprenoid biosynthesis glyoxalase ElbB [Fluviicola taffensis]|uniref:Isoprenoid biosynthesis protein with amidotransferase-like domain protein n=1 Tax=Fluviicola taffensis (strain DSM 16823 / NCIMB 13979 / RW262) TaxID=755732 RepID=F2IE26_FLUTR|nr:isoprenoid biosynthesis glyoxalase ElbB [Fluviicola taffensis]AEA45590.1 isoprenoid biosynthesis protein with amidotransferase-like domain protein [Fluviicola taffensis DSM 16823]